MPDPNVVLAQFPSADAARAAMTELEAALAAHFAYLREHTDADISGISPVLESFASRAGFAWDEYDGFVMDEMDPLDPALKMGAVGCVAYIGHAAASSIGEDGIASYLRGRGATEVIKWRMESTPATLTIRFTSAIGVAWLRANVASVLGAWNEETVFEGVPPPEKSAAVVAFVGEGLSMYFTTSTSWCVIAPLYGVASRTDVDASLGV